MRWRAGRPRVRSTATGPRSAPRGRARSRGSRHRRSPRPASRRSARARARRRAPRCGRHRTGYGSARAVDRRKGGEGLRGGPCPDGEGRRATHGRARRSLAMHRRMRGAAGGTAPTARVLPRPDSLTLQPTLHRATSIRQNRHGPILPTLLRLSAPNVVAMALAVLVAIAETFYVGLLGTTPLAALGLVFPFAMLTGTLSAGAMGGGVSSAIARAIGANDMDRAHTLAMHAILIGGAMGIAYSLFFVLGGPALFRWLGGRGGVLDEAVRYAGVLFSGAIFVWMSNTLASVVRGTGNMRVPSI